LQKILHVQGNEPSMKGEQSGYIANKHVSVQLNYIDFDIVTPFSNTMRKTVGMFRRITHE